MNDELRKILGIIVLCGILILAFIASSLIRMVDKYVNPQTIQPQVEQVKVTPILSMPTPSKGYFVECMNDDVAWVFHNDLLYYCTCEVGKWVYKEAPYDQDYRNFKLPNPQGHDTGAL